MLKKFKYESGYVSNKLMEEALNFFINIEEACNSISNGEDPDLIFELYSEEIRMAKLAIHEFGKQIEPRTLEKMQDVFYSIVNSPKYSDNPIGSSAIYSTINSAWNMIGPWRS